MLSQWVSNYLRSMQKHGIRHSLDLWLQSWSFCSWHTLFASTRPSFQAVNTCCKTTPKEIENSRVHIYSTFINGNEILWYQPPGKMDVHEDIGGSTITQQNAMLDDYSFIRSAYWNTSCDNKIIFHSLLWIHLIKNNSLWHTQNRWIWKSFTMFFASNIAS